MNRSRVVCVVLAVGLGCGPKDQPAKSGRETHDSATPAPQAPPVSPAAQMAAKAEAALADSVRLDYRRPMSEEPIERGPVRELFFRACRAGDHRSCWMVLSVFNRSGRADAYDEEVRPLIRNNCLAGDQMSCRAISWPSGGPQTLDSNPGAVSRACMRDDAPCDFEALRRECQAGLPSSCGTLVLLQPKAPDTATSTAALVRLAREGCRAGILTDCDLIPDIAKYHPDGIAREDLIFAYSQACTLELDGCEELGKLYEPSDPARAAVAFEKACQLIDYTNVRARLCEHAWRLYTDPKSAVPEPVPGRAKQLRDWACSKHEACWGG